MIKEHDRVVLKTPVPSEGLEAGDVGTVVHIHQDSVGYAVEFVTLTGETVGVVTLLAVQVRPIARRDLTHSMGLRTAAAPVRSREGSGSDRASFLTANPSDSTWA